MNGALIKRKDTIKKRNMRIPYLKLNLDYIYLFLASLTSKDYKKVSNILSQLSDWLFTLIVIMMNIMNKNLVYIAVLMFGLSSSLAAQDQPVTVLELFTSQGCVSCVSADAALKAHRGRPGMLVLSWPVDYLDRFGWADTFAHPANTWRQKAYNKRLGKGGMVYTPEMIIDGRIECIGNNKEMIRDEIDVARALEYARITPVISEKSGSYKVSLPETKLEIPIAVRAVWYLSDSTIEVTGGENEGKWLHLTNIVRYSTIIGEWDGRAKSFEISAGDTKIPMSDGIAILLHQDYGHGAIVGAASASFDGS